ncbi:MAG: hypothetical protein ABSE62_16610, partial [Chthoniobacteraceae bacterium]
LLPRLRVKALLASISAFALWLLVLRVHGSTIQQVLGSYLSVADRGLSPDKFQFMQELTLLEKVLSFLALFASCLPWVVVVMKPARLGSARSMISLFALAAGTYGFVSNNDLKVVDLPLQLLSGIFLIASPDGEKMKLTLPRPWRLYLCALLSVLTSVSIAQAVTRHRVLIMGYGVFFEYELRDAPLSNDFFRGLHAGENLEAIIEEISDVRNLPGRRSIFFGPRLQWAYAAFHIDSPRNEPIFWQPGVMFRKGDESLYVDNWLKADYDSLVFLDPLYYPQSFQKAIDARYGVDRDVPSIALALGPDLRKDRLRLIVMKKRPLPGRGVP